MKLGLHLPHAAARSTSVGADELFAMPGHHPAKEDHKADKERSTTSTHRSIKVELWCVYIFK